MGELRKLEKAVNKYEEMLLKNQEEAKRNKEIYINDVKMLVDFIEEYIEDISNKLQIWCDVSVSVFDQSTNNIFLKTKRAIDMKIVNHYLNKFSKMMSKAGLLQRRLEKIQKRFEQYKCFC